ncbi:MAG: hypothetical protein U5O16_40775 [Rhodococcus sp. (in: high G+C Gram-positive bacteria)]|uniref:hypothetical protein n=1 Tax=Rhodococcus sp. TaxID=1831 RepID=UPI002ADAC1CC|nr:hypothetical protein [Rhodococcus sp. (in: high G+C Gram-positive bacteria)]
MHRFTQPAPIPDPMTGEPRPPSAPRTESKANRSTPPGKPTTDVVVPVEMGPPLEWCEESKHYPLQGAIFIFCFGLLCWTFVYRGFDWLTDWFPWTFLSVMSALFFRKLAKDRVIAGARWVQQRDEWVSTYELAKIRSTTFGLNRAMSIRDTHGNNFVLVLRPTQQNPLLWNLVYNGIAHSVAHGNCDISKAARRILKL